MFFSKLDIYNEMLRTLPSIFNDTNNAKNHCLLVISKKLCLCSICSCGNCQDKWIQLNDITKRFISNIQSKLASCHYNKEHFLVSQANWLSSPFLAESFFCNLVLPLETNSGRPPLKWFEKSPESKKKEYLKLSNENELEKLVLASASKARKEKKNSLSLVLKESIKSETSAELMLNYYQKCIKSDISIKLTNDEALAFLLNTNISKSNYNYVRKTCLSKNAEIFPVYDQVLKAKEKCYPFKKENFSNILSLEESMAEINLQDLLQHTFDRLIQIETVQKEIKVFLATNRETLHFDGVFHCKWG